MRLHPFENEDAEGLFIDLDKVEAVVSSTAFGPYKGSLTRIVIGGTFHNVRGDYREIARLVIGVEA